MARHTGPPPRMTDRIERMAARVLVAAGLLLVLLGCETGLQVHGLLAGQGRMEAEERVPAVARLLSDAVPHAPYATATTVMVSATWQDRAGTPQTGLVAAPRDLRRGDTVAIWIDASGAEVPPPTSEIDAVVGGLLCGGSVLGGGIGLLIGLWALVRRLTMAVDCAQWEAEWRAIAPVWTGDEGTRE